MEEKTVSGKKNFLKIFYEEISRSSFTIIILAILTGLILGGILAAATTKEIYEAFDVSFSEGIKESLKFIWKTYSSLFLGSFGNPKKMVESLSSGDTEAIRKAFKPFLESLVVTTPYLLTGVAVALGFQAGVFNIGGEGQLFMGSIMAAWAGFTFKGLSPIIHVPLALMIGVLAGALWGFIPGWLKAKTGSHEVITTIMMNYIAFSLSQYLITGPFVDPNEAFKTPFIEESAHLFRFFEDPLRLHIGIIIAIAVAFLVWYILYKTTWGFEFRTVGLNPHAAKYSGINSSLITILALTLSGAIAGLAGAVEMLGVNFRAVQSLTTGYGFDAIAIALLAKNHPLVVIITAMMFGFMRQGSRVMQINTGIPIDIISILQAFILFFIAAPAIIRTIYRLKEPKEKDVTPQLSGPGEKI
ncbi:MAG: ABC transporter permease [Chloroflexota bacterium]|nr:ABC transporter permease [Chloroflexota bacterium]